MTNSKTNSETFEMMEVGIFRDILIVFGDILIAFGDILLLTF